jgi:hypothetical protein
MAQMSNKNGNIKTLTNHEMKKALENILTVEDHSQEYKQT